MLFPDLRAFLDRLRRDDDLVTVEAQVDPHLEVAEIHRRVVAGGGPALLFTNVKGSDFRLVTNLFGTAKRAEMAFGERPLRLIRRVVELIETIMPPTPAKLWGARDVGLEFLKVGTRRVAAGPVSERVESDVRLDRLPSLTCWPEDGGPFITLPLVYTTHPDRSGHPPSPGSGGAGPPSPGPGPSTSSGSSGAESRGGGAGNLGMYRMQVYDARTTGMHWQIGKGGGYHYAVAEGRGQKLPATVFLGGPPALILSAVAPLPENVPELMLASLIAGGRLAQIHGHGSHPLIANAEFALIGDVPPRLRKPEGPFGDHYGYYSLQHDYPVFEVSRIAHRSDAIYPATVVGKPRQEDFFIGDLLQELLSPLFPVVMPAVERLWSYGETGYHSLAAAIVKQRCRREAMASAFRILGEGQLSLSKFLLVTDQHVDVRNFRATLEHILARTRPETDLYVFSNLAMDTLDYTGPTVNEGSKGVWMGLGDPIRELPRQFIASEVPAGITGARVFCGGCLVVGAPSYESERDVCARIAAAPAFASWPLVVVSDEPERATRSDMNFLWTTFTRFEPAADIYAADRRIIRNHVAYTAPVVIDARMKPWYPRELSCREDIASLVSHRWREYFPSATVTMGDSERGHLD